MSVSVLMVRAFFDELQSRGYETASLLDVCGISQEQLADLRCRVDSERFAQLVERAVALSDDPAIGLSLGSRTPQSVLQIVGYLLLSSSCLRVACGHAFRYSAVLADAPRWNLAESQEEAILSFTCPVSAPQFAAIANDWALALSYRVVRYFAPPGAETLEESSIAVGVGHARPKYAQTYRRHFGCSDVRFGSKVNSLRFPRTWLDLPHLHGDNITCNALQAVAEDLLKASNAQTSLADRLRVALRHQADIATLDAQALARLAGLSPSSLRRQLASEGTAPLALLDEARCAFACIELRRPGTSVKQLAAQLGYADISSFHRAFKRWTGNTPASYRETAPPPLEPRA